MFTPSIDCVCEKCGTTFNKFITCESNVCLFCESEKKDKAQEIVIKSEVLDTSELDGCDAQKKLWRPEKFDQYVGQDNLKKIIQAYIKGSRDMKVSFPHMMIDGNAGTGKTTIAYLVAKNLGKNFVECVANTIKSPQQFVDKLVECNGGILFLDEIHMINKQVANFILPILEDFQINGKRIKPFTFFACTTELGVVIKKFKPLVDRMKIQKTLEAYSLTELTTITKQYRQKSFSDYKVDDALCRRIAENSRGTPRVALRLLESYIFMSVDFEEVLQSYNIIRDGITISDVKVLTILNETEKGVGLKSLCAYLATSEANYLYQIENYLLYKGLITINTRRNITDKGRNFLKCLK